MCWHTPACAAGEVLALRWRDLDTGIVAVRRSAGIVRVKGTRGQITEGPTKTGKVPVVDLDPATVAILRAHKAMRGSLHLSLAAADALVFADEQGTHLHPERFSRTFVTAVKRCAAAGNDVPVIRTHDLRHTHASLL